MCSVKLLNGYDRVRHIHFYVLSWVGLRVKLGHEPLECSIIIKVIIILNNSQEPARDVNGAVWDVHLQLFKVQLLKQ